VIKVSLLGPPRVELDGNLVAFDTRKAVALLAHLALSDRPRPREVLADLLWPEADAEHARGALRRTLSTLRAVVGSEFIEATRDHVRLVKGAGLDVDVDHFRALRQEGQLEAAEALFRGGFLEGFAVRDAPAFESWVREEGDVLARELTSTLADLVAAHEAAGDLRAALPTALRWLAFDPLHEPAHQAVMRCHAATGDRAAALVQYRTCVGTLSRELGVPPLTETTQLYDAINRGTYVPAAPSVPHAAPASPPLVMPFVGRADELKALRAVYDSVGADGRVVLVEGEAGIGKTRLAAELVSSVRRDGANVLTGRAFEGETGLAYSPVTEALEGRLRTSDDWSDAVSERGLAEAARLVPTLAGRAAGSEAPPAGHGAEARFLSGVWETLAAAAGGNLPGVLWIDDVQHADGATLSLLSYGLRRLAGRPLLVLLTWRTPHDHPLPRNVAAAAREGSGAIVRLGRLGAPSVSAMVRAARPGDEDPPNVRQLLERTEGVPLLLVEYLRSPAVDGDWPLPSGADDVLRARLDPVSETAAQVLSAAAVLGRSFDVDTVRAVSGRTDEETATSLEELVRLGLVQEGASDYDFSHGLLRSLVYNRTSLARRRLLHGRAADLIDAPAAVARHHQLAGHADAAAHAFRIAGEQARQVFANAEALDHLRAALRLGHPDRTGLHMSIGDVLTVAGEYSAAQLSFEAAAESGAPNHLSAVEHRLGRLQHRRGEYALAAAHLQAALAAASGVDVVHRAAITADLSLTAHSLGDADRARAFAGEAMVLAEQSDDARARCRASNLLGMLAAEAGDTDDGLRHLQRSRELAERLGDDELRIAALNNLALTQQARGELERATELTRAALELCAAMGDRHHEAALQNNLADLMHATGQETAAMAHLKSAVEIFADIGAEEAPRPEIWKLVRW
jgi:DNA-binding SARP family transcriptional activator/tetratricopeptide (TPR) repeat protein